jgi:hypothetical protein
VAPHDRSALVGPSFFPNLISGPFRDGLHAAFAFAIIACLVAAGASLMRGDARPAHDPLRVTVPSLRDGADTPFLED